MHLFNPTAFFSTWQINITLCRAHFPCLSLLFRLTAYLKVVFFFLISTSKQQYVILPIHPCTFSHVAVPTLTPSSSPPSYSFYPFSVFTATLQLHPCLTVLLFISSALFPLALHHTCLSFRAEAAPVKLILSLCWGAPSTHRLGFPLSLSLRPSVFLFFLPHRCFPISLWCWCPLSLSSVSCLSSTLLVLILLFVLMLILWLNETETSES